MASASKARSVGVLAASRLLGIILQLVAVRVYVSVLGVEGYAVPLYFAALVGNVVYCDLGIPQAVQRAILDARANNRISDIGRLETARLRGLRVSIFLAVLAYAMLWLVLPIPAVQGNEQRFLLFTLSSAHAVALLLFTHYNAILAAYEEFGALALANGVLTSCQPLLGIPLVLALRKPEALLGAMAASAALASIISYGFSRRRPKLNRSTSDGLIGLILSGVRMAGARFLNQVAGSVDRLIIPRFGASLLTQYQIPWQVCQTLLEICQPMYQVLFADIAKASCTAPHERKAKLERSFLLAASVGASVIVLGSGYGPSLIRLWIPAPIPNVGILCLALGVYKGFEYMLNAFGVTFFAIGRMELLVPFAGFNALATALLTGPVLLAWGITGVGIQNALVAGVLVVPMLLLVKSAVSPSLPVAKVSASSVGYVSAMFVCATVLVAFSSHLTTNLQNLLFLMSAPLAVCIGWLLQVVAFRAPVPQAMMRFTFVRILRPDLAARQ